MYYAKVITVSLSPVTALARKDYVALQNGNGQLFVDMLH